MPGVTVSSHLSQCIYCVSNLKDVFRLELCILKSWYEMSHLSAHHTSSEEQKVNQGCISTLSERVYSTFLLNNTTFPVHILAHTSAQLIHE